MSRARVAWAISLNELRRIASRKEIFVFGLGLPVVIMTLIGLTFGGAGSVDLGVLDRDHSAASRAVIERLEQADGVSVETYDRIGHLRIDVRTTAVSAGLVIPKGYGAALDRGEGRVQVVADPTSEGVASAIATIDGAVADQGVVEAAVDRLVAAGETAPDARRLVDRQAARLAPVEVERLADLGEEVETGSFSYTVPANLTLFVFINTFVVSTILAVDRRSGVIARMLSTPTRPGVVLGGLGLSKLAFALVQSAVLVLVGTVAFGVVWGDPLAAAVLVGLFAVLSTSVGLLVGSWVGNADQAQAIGIPVGVGAGMLGGCMWPVSIVPRPMQVLGHLTPHAWAMDAWQELIYDGRGLGAILPNLAVLAGMAAVVGPLAARTLRRSTTG